MSSSYSFTYVNSEPVATNRPFTTSADHSPSPTEVNSTSSGSNHQAPQPRPEAVLQEIIDEFARRAAEEAGSPPPGFKWGTRVNISTAEQFPNETNNERDPNDIPQWDLDGDDVATNPERRRGWINKLNNIAHDRAALRALLDKTDDTVSGAIIASIVEKGKLVHAAFDEATRDARSLLELSQHLGGQVRDLNRQFDRLAELFDNYRTTTLAYTATDQSAQETIHNIWLNHFGNINVDHLEPEELLRGAPENQRIRHPRHPPPARYRTRFPAQTRTPSPIPIPIPPSTQSSNSVEPEQFHTPVMSPSPSPHNSPTSYSFRRPGPYDQRRRPRSPITRAALDRAFPGNSRANPTVVD